LVTDQIASELVFDCVRRDYRWDRGVDERGVSLARLVIDLGLPIDPIAPDLPDWPPAQV
jgi:hypothetical protein